MIELLILLVCNEAAYDFKKTSQFKDNLIYVASKNEKLDDDCYLYTVEKLKKKNIEVIVDGVDKIDISQKCKAIVKADNIYEEVMAASIIAKVYRDELMIDLDKKYPQYLFAKHKGYPTKDHLHALKKFGSIEEHRKTFGPVKKLNE